MNKLLQKSINIYNNIKLGEFQANCKSQIYLEKSEFYLKNFLPLLTKFEDGINIFKVNFT